MAFDARVAAAILAAVTIAAVYLFMDPLDERSSGGESSPPDANIEVSATSVLSGRSVLLSGSGSTGGIVEYRWAFGDGRQDTGENVTVSYDVVGRYRIALTVADAGGRTDTDFVSVRVNGGTWYNDSVDQSEQTDIYDIEVIYDEGSERPEQKAQGIVVNLTYDSEHDLGTENNLTMSLRDPQGNVVRRNPDRWGEVRGTGRKYALIVVAYQETAERGGDWELEIEYDRGGIPGVDTTVAYNASVTVLY